MGALGRCLYSISAVVLILIEAVCCSGYYYNEPWRVQNNEAQQPHQSYYDLPPHHARILPRELMVDVINNLALTLLEVHNQQNDNNIALSPYGATSVLVALAEGLLGDAAREVIQAGNIPGDLPAVRVGLRDIHRHLKSYFIPKEGFLAGLTLNNGNVTLNPEYEHILRFYGYDINSFNTVFYPESTSKASFQTTTQQAITSPSGTTPMPPLSTTSPEIETSAQAKITTLTVTTEKGTTSIIDESTETVPTIKAERTTRKDDGNAGTISINVIESRDDGQAAEIKSTTPSGLQITKPKTGASTKKLKAATTVVYESTEDITMSETRYPTTVLQTTAEIKGKTTEEITTVKSTDAPTTSMDLKLKSIEVMESTTSATPKINSIFTNPSITIEEITTTFIPPQTKPVTLSETTISTTESIPTTPSETSTYEFDMTTPIYTDFYSSSDLSTTAITIPSDASNVVYTDYNVAPSYDDYNALTNPSDFPGTFDGTASTPNYSGFPTDAGDVLSTVNPVFDTGADFNITAGLVDPLNSTVARRSTRSVVDYIIAKYYDNYDFGQRRQYYVPPAPVQSDYQPEPALTFLVNGHVPEANINFMTYDTILPFYFVRGLNALALSFPLDSAKYYLLLVLPVEPDGIDMLICNFKQVTTLKGIIENLKYTHVKAIIPSFNLKGYVILTPTFQKIGIRKIFEPRQADFSQMTTEKDIYVTNIEQAITVTIRNYVDENTLPHNGKFRNYRPVDFVADHPFLYFVMDSEMHVSLMAGKILNPLNSRIR